MASNEALFATTSVSYRTHPTMSQIADATTPSAHKPRLPISLALGRAVMLRYPGDEARPADHRLTK